MKEYLLKSGTSSSLQRKVTFQIVFHSHQTSNKLDAICFPFRMTTNSSG
jgi:hypothetical protein